jgi:hypothetical protein
MLAMNKTSSACNGGFQNDIKSNASIPTQPKVFEESFISGCDYDEYLEEKCHKVDILDETVKDNKYMQYYQGDGNTNMLQTDDQNQVSTHSTGNINLASDPSHNSGTQYQLFNMGPINLPDGKCPVPPLYI